LDRKKVGKNEGRKVQMDFPRDGQVALFFAKRWIRTGADIVHKKIYLF
jgi:hypothetical protein